MALRLRRGTDAERQLVTPVEGELVYVTDTKSLYVGDGETQGGILVASSGDVSNTIFGLLDTNLQNLKQGDLLVYNAATGDFTNSQSALNIEDLIDVIFTGESSGDLLAYDGVSWSNRDSSDLITSTVNGLQVSDIGGVIYNGSPKNGDALIHDGGVWSNRPLSSFADKILSARGSYELTIIGTDSSILVDPVNNTLRGNLQGDLYDILGNLIVDEFAKTALVDVRDPTNTYTVLDNFTGDLRRGENGQTIIQGGTNPVFIGNVDGSVKGTIVGPDLQILLNHDSGTLFGDVVGSVYSSDSSLIIDGETGILSANIINASVLTASLADPFTGEVKDIEFVSAENNEVNLRLFRKEPVADATQTDIGAIFFDGVDKNDGDFQSTGSYIYSTAQQNGTDPYLKTKISMGTIDGAGNPTSDNNFTVTWEGNFGVGTDDPSTKLDVNGDIKAEGSITPGVYADDAARDAAITAPAAGMMVFNTTGAKFQGYDGTAWVNLN